MRALILISVTFLFVEGGESAFAKSDKPAAPLLKIVVESRYGIRSTVIRREGSAWTCKTELAPYHFSPVAPFTEDAIAGVRTASVVSEKIFNECRDKVSVSENVRGADVTYRGCASDKAFAMLNQQTNRNCGRD